MSTERPFTSCAEWPADTFTASDGSHVSTDTHHTAEEADAVCRMLARDGFGGRGVRPLRTWVDGPGVAPPSKETAQ